MTRRDLGSLRSLFSKMLLVALMMIACGAIAITGPAGAVGVPDSVRSGAALKPGDHISSGNGQFDLWMQGDGNLVLYSQRDVLWSTNTYNNPGATLWMQGDGNLVLYSTSHRVLWNSGTWGKPGGSLVLQSDGNLVIYRSSQAVWSSGSHPSALRPNQILRSDWRLVSPDWQFLLVMQTDGNLVLYAGNRAIWASGTQGNPGALVVMQGDGNLVVYSAVGRALWASGTSGRSGSTLVIQNDSNLVIYLNGSAIWARTGCCSSGAPAGAREERAAQWATAEKNSPNPRMSDQLRHAWSGFCESFVEIAFGTIGRFGSATIHYNWQRSAGRIHTDPNPPRGALVFYGGGDGYGHIGVSIGGGQVISTQGLSGQYLPVWQHGVTALSNPYLGWAYAPPDWPGR